MTKSISIPSFCSKIALLNEVPKYGSPKRVIFPEFNSNTKFEAVASLSLNNNVLVLENILGKAIEYTKSPTIR